MKSSRPSNKTNAPKSLPLWATMHAHGDRAVETWSGTAVQEAAAVSVFSLASFRMALSVARTAIR